jgi:hypothetical protein
MTYQRVASEFPTAKIGCTQTPGANKQRLSVDQVTRYMMTSAIATSLSAAMASVAAIVAAVGSGRATS